MKPKIVVLSTQGKEYQISFVNAESHWIGRKGQIATLLLIDGVQPPYWLVINSSVNRTVTRLHSL